MFFPVLINFIKKNLATLVWTLPWLPEDILPDVAAPFWQIILQHLHVFRNLKWFDVVL
jgi:hypothetical protein